MDREVRESLAGGPHSCVMDGIVRDFAMLDPQGESASVWRARHVEPDRPRLALNTRAPAPTPRGRIDEASPEQRRRRSVHANLGRVTQRM